MYFVSPMCGFELASTTRTSRKFNVCGQSILKQQPESKPSWLRKVARVELVALLTMLRCLLIDPNQVGLHVAENFSILPPSIDFLRLDYIPDPSIELASCVPPLCAPSNHRIVMRYLGS